MSTRKLKRRHDKRGIGPRKWVTKRRGVYTIVYASLRDFYELQ